MRLPAAAASLHVPRPSTGAARRAESDRAGGRRDSPQPALAEREAARVAKGRLAARRGRLVALLLVGFVLVATGVIWRRSHGFARARVLRDLERRRQALVATKVQLEGAIRDASSRSRLEPIVRERLQMQLPADSQVIYLQRPTRCRECPAPVARPNAPR